MEFASLTEALTSQSYDKIADICDKLMLEVAVVKGDGLMIEWPYTVHLLGHLYANDVNSARFLWKSIPSAVKEGSPELVAAWKIGQSMWTRDYVAVHQAIRDFTWSPVVQGIVTAFSELYTTRMFDLLLLAYSTISIQDASLFLGMDEDKATKYVVERGWIVDTDAKMLTVKKQEVTVPQKLDSSKLQRLTEYVFHLEH